MNKQEKLDKIYKVIARKDLSFGCKLKGESDGVFLQSVGNKHYIYTPASLIVQGVDIKQYILGHPVMIGDVLEWIQENTPGYDSWRNELYEDLLGDMFDGNKNNRIWKKLREPIESQSEECVDYVYKLLEEHLKG